MYYNLIIILESHFTSELFSELISAFKHHFIQTERLDIKLIRVQENINLSFIILHNSLNINTAPFQAYRGKGARASAVRKSGAASPNSSRAKRNMAAAAVRPGGLVAPRSWHMCCKEPARSGGLISEKLFGSLDKKVAVGEKKLCGLEARGSGTSSGSAAQQPH